MQLRQSTTILFRNNKSFFINHIQQSNIHNTIIKMSTEQKESTPTPTETPQKIDVSKIKSLYELTSKDKKGNDVPLKQYDGNVTLVVNVASKCGFTVSLIYIITKEKK